MEEGIIGFEQFLAGAILKFKVVDVIDISLLMNELKTKKIVNTSLHNIKEYIRSKNGITSLKKNFNFDTYIESKEMTVKDSFDSIQGETLKNFFEHIDFEKFTLRKIDMLKKYNLKSCVYFNSQEIKAINELEKQGLIICFKESEILNKNLKEILITKNGRVCLFKEKYSKDLFDFKVKLLSLGYDECLLNQYLLACNLENEVKNILSLHNFEEFYYIYNNCLDCKSKQKNK